MLICAVTDCAWRLARDVNQWTATQAEAASMELTGTHNGGVERRESSPVRSRDLLAARTTDNATKGK